jgi:micrococcal nuclease
LSLPLRLAALLVIAGIVILILRVLAPLLILGAIAMVGLALWRPALLARVASHRAAGRLPAWVRSTPLRLALVSFAVIVPTSVLAASVGSAAPDQTDAPASAPQAAAATAMPTRTARATAEPTERPTPTPTVVPSPSPVPAPVFGEEPTGLVQAGTVVAVVDGDTIDVDVAGTVFRVRYIGMDTPETRSGVEWMGAEASAANESLVAGTQVLLEKDVSETDQYGRLLRYVWVAEGEGWLLVNLELIRLGYAQISTYPPDVKYADNIYVQAEREAIEAGRGLWAPTPTPAPTPVAVVTPVPFAAPIAPPVAPPSDCDPSYPTLCLPIGAADIDCPEMYAQGIARFPVVWSLPNPDPHGFDGDADGIGCEG